MKEKLEVIFDQDGNPCYLNFWDYAHGNDVVCTIRDNRLYARDGSPTTFDQFLQDVKESIGKRKI